jgi:hypothetical protein
MVSRHRAHTHAAMLLEDTILDQLMFRCMLDDESGSRNPL